MRLRFGALTATLVLFAVGACAAPAQVQGTPAAPVHHHSPVPEPPVAPLRAGERFLKLTMPTAYTPIPPPGATDEYRCFLIDPHLTSATYVTGSQFLPQNADIVHHAIVFKVPPSMTARASALEKDGPGQGWTCFGGAGLGGVTNELKIGDSWIAAWAPGAKETLLTAKTGYLLQPGSQFILQVHYNLLATNGKAGGTDQSSLRLRLVDGSAHLSQLQTTLVPAPVELPCAPTESGPLCDRQAAIQNLMQRFGARAGSLPAGLGWICNGGAPPPPGPTQHCDLPVREAGTVYAVAGHMHLLGRSIKVELNPGTPGARTLLNVPVYNFDDQSARLLPKPVAIKPGDKLRVTCTHDATLRSKLPALSTLPPRYVVWGDGTADEMCLGIVVWSRPGTT
jgi:Copper type II ascorbate-dependent monooxygenase, C-terminal domain